MYRTKKILNIIPRDVKSVLDIGSAGKMFNEFYDTKTVDLEKADINQDLNKIQKFSSIADNSFDIVILNQILEHLNYVEEIIVRRNFQFSFVVPPK
jgi:predicted SAM-dependent methyltransferase